MSGTSMDGVDLSVIKSDGNDQFSSIYDTYKEFDDGLYKQLISLRDKISNFTDLKTHSKEINDVEKKFTLFNSHLINEVIGHINEDIDLIVSSYELNVLDGQEVVDSKKVQVADQRIETHDDFLTHLYSLMNQQLMYVVWNKIYRLDIVKENKIQFPPYKSCEDRLFNIAYFHHVQSCLIMNDIMYSYTFDGKNSLTNKFLENKFEINILQNSTLSSQSI